MANAIVSFAVQRIGDLLIQEAEFFHGVSDQVENIQTELKRMQCFLKDADSKASNGDERVRNWVAEIRDLAYDAEDVIETYALKVASGRQREGIMNVLKRFVCILNEGKAVHKVGLEIEAITAKISNLTSSLQTCGIKGMANESSSSAYQMQRQLRRSYSHVAERDVVGQDEGIRELVKNLLDNEKNCRLVSIWGMGGLGKTTLARKVYHHVEVGRWFDYLTWSCISQQCQTRDVWEGILIKLKEPRDEITKLRHEELARKLYQVLQEKRCLVILDDIWSIEAWDSLRNAFPYEETNSKILLTTRNQEVALHADPTGFHYEPRCLDEEESWKLLQKIVTPRKDGTGLRIDTRMEELGKKMVQHCGGLPLAVTVLGGLLAAKYSSNEWHIVHETIKSCLRRGKGHGQEQLGVLDVLALSYDDLPTELKPCFLYLSHFPEDYQIRVDKLIQLWVAEGIIKSEQHSEEGEETLEDAAERYLNELVKRCMVLVRETGCIKTCHMHDFMRDLCLSKAKEENFLCVVRCWNGDENVDIFPSSSSGKIRRVAINVYGNQSRGPLKRIQNRRLRSLLLFPFIGNDDILPLEKFFFEDLKLLRVLYFEGVSVPWNPKDICKLIHLRFLSIRYARIDKLPSSLGNLKCLQSLDLRVSTQVYIPNVLWKMKGLRHLYLPSSYYSKTKLRLGNLRNLQTLGNFSFLYFDVSEFLNNMPNLRRLKIRDLYLIKDSGEIFKSRGITLKHLWCLIIDSHDREKIQVGVGQLISGCINLYYLSLWAKIENLPDCHQFPASITEIDLWYTQLEEDPMATLEKLPNLRTLSLQPAFIGKQMVCSEEGFPRLHSLRLDSLVNLEEWRVDEGALPNLCDLKISCCKKLKTFPDGLRFVKTLQELEINSMPKEFKEKLVEGGEDFFKVQHVPSVIFHCCDY